MKTIAVGDSSDRILRRGMLRGPAVNPKLLDSGRDSAILGFLVESFVHEGERRLRWLEHRTVESPASCQFELPRQ